MKVTFLKPWKLSQYPRKFPHYFGFDSLRISSVLIHCIFHNFLFPQEKSSIFFPIFRFLSSSRYGRLTQSFIFFHQFLKYFVFTVKKSFIFKFFLFFFVFTLWFSDKSTNVYSFCFLSFVFTLCSSTF